MEHEEQISRRYARLPEPDLAARDAALLVIDMQYGGAHRDYGTLRRLAERGDAVPVEYYAARVETLVVPNICRLQAAYRAAEERSFILMWAHDQQMLEFTHCSSDPSVHATFRQEQQEQHT